jgi:hypothetical protein
LNCHVDDCTKIGVENCLAVGCCKNHGCGKPTCSDHFSKKVFVRLDMYTKPYTCCVDCEKKVGCLLWTNMLIPFSVIVVLLLALIIMLVLYNQK